MSTRALYTFKGEDGSFNVYKHHDGYPSGALSTLQNTLAYFAWKLPRFESDEFAAAFCAAGKAHYLIQSTENDAARKAYLETQGPQGSQRDWMGGGVRLMPSGDPLTVARTHCGDIEYRYEIWFDNELQIAVFRSVGNFGSTLNNEVIYSGSFEDFNKWALKKEHV